MAKQGSDGWNAGGYIRFGLFCVLLLAGGLGTWSATAKLAGAVVSSGSLRVESQRQVIQHPDGGVVGQILARDGAVVEAGDILIKLDGTTLRSELVVLESQLFEIMARRGRLLAEQAELQQITFDAELLEVARERPEVNDLINGQLRLFTARSDTMHSEMDMLDERKLQIREQIVGSEAEIASLEEQASLVTRELTDMQSLLDRGLAQASRVLALRREAARIEGDRGRLVAQTAQLRGQISELGREALNLEAQRREEAITQLREIGYRELELKERRIALLEQLSRLDIRAPRSGVIYDSAVHALKAVVRPAEPIMYIVPSDAQLIVDAQIDPLHVDEVRPMQDTVLRFAGFNTRTTPEIAGQVLRVSPDAFTEEQTGRTYYRADVVLAEGEIEKLQGLELLPGMPVEVYIQTGERTPLNYLMKPLSDYFNKALREE
ncbi:MAG: HlyD family type I secretion periplasmic adaptor subunit [Pseudomonadota bacterium]